jgi:hypothetical protein
MDVDISRWSGEGAFTQTLIEWLQRINGIAAARVEDAPASRSEADYNFISNEVFVVFSTETVREAVRRFGFLPGTRSVNRKTMTMTGLEEALTASEIGPPDYSDAGMMQYLRTERIIPAYQTRGYKLVELVRIYEAGVAAQQVNEARESSRH